MNRTLDSNQLSGTIPTQLGNIKDLIYLYVNIYYSSLWFSKKKKKKKKKKNSPFQPILWNHPNSTGKFSKFATAVKILSLHFYLLFRN